MASKQINFTVKNAKPFVGWLKKFSSINNSLMIEIDEETSTFLAKTYNDERSVVKFSKIGFQEAGFEAKPSKDPKRVKLGILHISKLVKIIEQFSEGNFTVTVNYDEMTGDAGTDFAGVTLLFKNTQLKVTEDCTSLSIFRYISDDKFVDVIASIESPVAEFPMTKDSIQRINSLSVLDNDNKFLEFVLKNSKVFVSGKVFELDISGGNEVPGNDMSLSIFKDQFENIDIEEYQVVMGEDRLVFNSKDSETITVASMVEKDE